MDKPSPPHLSDKNELLPLIIGITGHRNLREEDIPSLENAVSCVLRELRERYPHTPLVALSPLGEGADRLVARIALDLGAQLFVPLPLPRDLYESSFSSDESRAEFSALVDRATSVFTLPWLGFGHESKIGAVLGAATEAQTEGQYAAMGAYIARYSHVFLALWDGDDTPAHERTGGTSQIVRFRLHSAPPPYGPVLSPLERAGYGAVHHIVTPRQSNPVLQQEPFSCHILPNVQEAEDFSRIDVFNADVLNFRNSMGQGAQDNAASLVGSAKPNGPSKKPDPELISNNIKPCLGIYGWSDTLSTYFSRQMATTVRRIFFLVFLAAISFNLFHSLPHGDHGSGGGHEPTEALASEAHPTTGGTHATDTTHAAGNASHSTGSAAHGTSADTHVNTSESHAKPPVAEESHGSTSGHSTPTTPADGHAPATESHGESGGGDHGAGGHGGGSLWSLLPWFLWIYLGLVIFNFLMHQRAEKHDYQNKYQDYRALAEGLRVQIFWRLAGLRDDVSDHYLAKQRGELNWIRNAIKSCNVLSDAQATGKLADEGERMALVVGQWVREQRNYYVRKAHREHEELEKQEHIIAGFLVGSVVLAALLGLLLSLPVALPYPIFQQLKEAVEDPMAHAFIMITIVMLAVIAGLLHAYNQQLARAEHSKRYNRMGIIFDEASKELEVQLKAGHFQKMHSIIHELGREALVENGDWVMLHRERPLEVPHAG